MLRIDRRRFVTAAAGAFVASRAPMLLAQSSSTATWQPLFDLDDLFPSFILATATAAASQNTSANYIGDPFGLVGIGVRTSADNTRIRMQIAIDQIADPTALETALGAQGEYRIYPKIKYRYQTLSAIRQPLTVNVSISVSIDSAPPETRTATLRVRSINDAVTAVRLSNGTQSSKAWTLVAFVNENHPAIDQILRQALNIPVPIVREFVGTQQGPQMVVNQVFAIWYLFQRLGFTYSSITTPSGFSDKVQSQTVRFLEDSVRTRQSNCIDGTVLFASILRKIGIEPFIVSIPGHAFLGFWMDNERKVPGFLETTAMNSTNNP